MKSGKRKMRRLQNKSWYDYRRNHHLTLICISKSESGNYRADVLDENGNHFYHWLHPIERRRLEASNWIKENKVYDSKELYYDNGYKKSTLLTQLIKEIKNKDSH